MTRPVERCWSLRCAALLLALVGLFAMHGLGEHGTHDAGAAAAHGSMVMAASGHPTHLVDPIDLLTPAHPAGRGLPMSAGAMCLAVLGLLLLGVLRLVGSGRRVPLWSGSSRPPSVPVARGRAPDPPGRFVLSVQRC